MLNILIAQLTITYERVISNMEAHGTHCVRRQPLFYTCKPVFFWYTCFAKHARFSSNVCSCACVCVCAWFVCVCARARVRAFVRMHVCVRACTIALQHRAHLDLEIEGVLSLGLIQLTTTNLFVGKLWSQY
jgi:hypothetical protein